MSIRARAVLVGGLLFACAAQPKGKEPTSTERGAPVMQSATLLSAVSSRFPAADAARVCADTQLRLGFNQAVRVGDAGRIQIFKASSAQEPVDSIDLGAVDFTNQAGERPFHVVRPVFVDGNEVIVYLHSHGLEPGETYFVTVDSGVFLSADGASLGELTGPAGWRFTTGRPAPADPSALSVALDGSADFCSVQGALDALPKERNKPASITLKNGIYREIVLVENQQGLTLRGEDRKKTVIAYPNNDNLQQRLGTRFRAMVEVENTDDLTIENLTLHNTTPQAPPAGAGYQAEALRVDPGHRIVLRNADFISRQDTLLLSGHVYVVDSYVEGNVDFIWGKGVAYFERTELKTVGRPGYLVQSRNPVSQYGYVFVDSKLIAEEGMIGTYLARIDANEYPGSNVAFVNCQLGPHIAPEGWLVTPAGARTKKDLRFWEYQSLTLDGQPVDTSRRASASRQLSDEQARALRDKVAVLGWDPGTR